MADRVYIFDTTLRDGEKFPHNQPAMTMASSIRVGPGHLVQGKTSPNVTTSKQTMALTLSGQRSSSLAPFVLNTLLAALLQTTRSIRILISEMIRLSTSRRKSRGNSFLQAISLVEDYQHRDDQQRPRHADGPLRECLHVHKLIH